MLRIFLIIITFIACKISKSGNDNGKIRKLAKSDEKEKNIRELTKSGKENEHEHQS